MTAAQAFRLSAYRRQEGPQGGGPSRPARRAVRAAPGAFAPVVNRARCEGKADCVAVCPHDVFEVGTIDEAEYRALMACPEKAISLVAPVAA